MKIAIINQPLANRGDEAAHKAFVRALSKQFLNYNIHIIFINSEDKLIEQFNVNKDNVKYFNLRGLKGISRFEKLSFYINLPKIALLNPVLYNYYKLIKEYDYVICAPGGICMGGFMNWDHLWQLYIAKILRKTIIYWGRSIGPFDNTSFKSRVFKRYSLELLQYFSFLSLRDSISFKLARKYSVNCVKMVDSAFLEVPKININAQIINSLKTKKYIVFVPNELTWHYKYKNCNKEKIDNFYINIINMITEFYRNYEIVMLPQTFMSKINDHDYFNHLKNLSKNGEKIIVINENVNSDMQQYIIANSDLVIGARYHTIVFAINNKKSFISLSYEHKMLGLLEELNLLKYSIDIQGIFNDEKIIDKTLFKINNLLKNLQFEKENPQFENKYKLANKMVLSAFNDLCKLIT